MSVKFIALAHHKQVTMDTNKIREALERRKAVLDAALEWTTPYNIQKRNEEELLLVCEALAQLAELDKAQQPAEPVAWMVKTRIGVEWVTTLGVTETGARQIAIERYRNGSDVQHMDPIPLYTHPPQAAGLTVDEFVRIAGDWFNHVSLNMSAGDDSASNPRARLEAAKQAKQ